MKCHFLDHPRSAVVPRKAPDVTLLPAFASAADKMRESSLAYAVSRATLRGRTSSFVFGQCGFDDFFSHLVPRPRTFGVGLFGIKLLVNFCIQVHNNTRIE